MLVRKRPTSGLQPHLQLSVCSWVHTSLEVTRGKGPRVPSDPTSSSGEWFLYDSALSEHEPHVMGLAVIAEPQHAMGVGRLIRGSVRRPAGLFGIAHDLDFISGLAAPQHNLEPLPIRRNARANMQFLSPLLHAENGLQGRLIEPSRRAGVPGPAAPPVMPRRGIDVCCHHIRLDAI